MTYTFTLPSEEELRLFQTVVVSRTEYTSRNYFDNWMSTVGGRFVHQRFDGGEQFIDHQGAWACFTNDLHHHSPHVDATQEAVKHSHTDIWNIHLKHSFSTPTPYSEENRGPSSVIACGTQECKHCVAGCSIETCRVDWAAEEEIPLPESALWVLPGGDADAVQQEYPESFVKVRCTVKCTLNHRSVCGLDLMGSSRE